MIPRFFSRSSATRLDRKRVSRQQPFIEVFVEPLEDRRMLAVFNIGAGDEAALIAAINTSNANNQADTINLAQGSTYEFTAVNNADNALPVIAVDTAANNTLTINGNGATLLRSGTNLFRFLSTDAQTVTVVQNLTFDNGNVTAVNGGAIESRGNLTVLDSVFRNNVTNPDPLNSSSGGRGGAIRSGASGNTTVVRSLFENNQGNGGTGGGAINSQNNLNVDSSRFNNNSGLQGGAIYAQGSTVITNNQFDGNTTPAGRGGGAILVNAADATVRNNTFTRNNASAGDAIAVVGNSTIVRFINNTAVNNNGDAIFIDSNSTPDLILHNNLLVRNNGGLQVNGTVNSGGSNNLIDTANGLTGISNGVNGNIIRGLTDAEAGVGAFLNNGGPTNTIGLLPTSLAIDAGNNAQVGSAFDQRGFDRISNTTVDIGAVEAQQPFLLTRVAGSGQSTVVNTAFDNDLIVQVREANNVLIVGATVNFSAPGSGASAAVTGSDTTDSGGLAQASAQANGVGGTYSVTATVAGTSLSTTFDLNNLFSADLSITKIGSFDPITGTLTYTVTVSNAGPTDALNVVVTDTLPPGVAFVSTTGCNNDPNGAPACNLGDIANGGSVQYTIEVSVGSDAPDVVTNVAYVTSDTLDPNTANNAVVVNTTVRVKDPGFAYVDVDNDGRFFLGVDVLLDDGELDDGIFNTRIPEGPDYTTVIAGAGLVITASTGGIVADSIRLQSDGNLVVDADLTATVGDIRLTSKQKSVLLDDPTLTAAKKIRVKAEKDFDATDGDVLTAGQRVVVRVGGNIDISNSTVQAVDKVRLNGTNVVGVGALIQVTGANGQADLRAKDSMTFTSARIEATKKVSLIATGSIFTDLAVLAACGTNGQVRVEANDLVDLSRANVRASRKIDVSSKTDDVDLTNSTIAILDGSTTGDIKVKAGDEILLDGAVIRGPDRIDLLGTLVDQASADIADGTLPCP